MDRLEAMTVVVAVAQHEGFAPAARALGLSAPAVTRIVAALEDRLETRLFNRTTRSVRLTEAGARYLERARRILSDVAEAEDDAKTDRRAPSGRLVLSAPSAFGRIHVAPVVSRLLAAHPAVSVELQLGDRMVSLVEEGVDAAVRIGTLEDSTTVARQVGATRRVVVASPNYLSSRKRPVTPDDLAHHDVIQFTPLTPTQEWSFFDHGGRRRVSLVPRYVTNSADAAIAHAEAGGGVAMLLAYQVRDAIREGRLEVLLAAYEPPASPIQIVYPTARLLSAKVRAFVDLVTTCDWSFV